MTEHNRGVLSEEQVRKEINWAFSRFGFKGKKLLAIIPDNTRSAPVATFFRLFKEEYSGAVKRLDYLIALGTHPLLTEKEMLRRVGIDRAQKEALYRDIGIFIHRWDRKQTFKRIGAIEEEEMEVLTGGLLKERVEIEINRIIYDYDFVLILGPVFPHEIAGFSGSNKYLFPGIGGWDFIDLTHWLGALETNLKIIGTKDTAPRRLIDRAAEMVSTPLVYFNLVVDHEGLKGIFVGDNRSSWDKAVDLSSTLNIRYVPRPFRSVLSIPSKKYEDFWTGAKAFYKIEPIVEEGGEVVVYAPNIKEISLTHGREIGRVGFHIKDYFVSNMERYVSHPRAVLAYSSLVKGAGTYSCGVERPRVKVILCSAVPEDLCRQMNIDYLDPLKLKPGEWEKRENEGIKVIRDAGEVLYRILPGG